ncbi:hypothetical protein V6N11_081446 [Hibiscus sabdariffa]|uniref:Uncharacterized protein n=1 Tax=Hibiscus sabdariffa TaxID=183260 RepID=A0ABR2N6Q1_9ROSI
MKVVWNSAKFPGKQKRNRPLLLCVTDSGIWDGHSSTSSGNTRKPHPVCEEMPSRCTSPIINLFSFIWGAILIFSSDKAMMLLLASRVHCGC